MYIHAHAYVYIYVYTYICICIIICIIICPVTPYPGKKLGCRTNLVLTQSQRNRMDSDTKNHVTKPIQNGHYLVESVRSLQNVY